MATLNLGRIKPVFQGAYNGSTAYVVDDIVTFGDETFICIQASTGNATSNASYWTKLAAKGTDGTDVGTTLTTQGDILYRDGSGLQRLAAGTSGQFLKTQGSGANPQWSTVSTGAYSIAQFTSMNLQQETHAGSATTAYRISSGSGSLQVTPDATTDLLHFNYQQCFEGSQAKYYGLAIGMNTSNSGWTTSTGNSQLVINLGEYSCGMGNGDDTERYQMLAFNQIRSASDLGMSAGTTYHFVPYVLVHSQAGGFKSGFNSHNSNSATNDQFSILRYKV